ncbi:FAR1-related protein [Striga asiatica]|uniref:FAR1-related protein n=1 Tax=Striga asiatica TaxID=4170 RepID=A0A5A7QTS4_STRAF|nr:FAR1-related protein [Striga asiatica]
MEDAPCQTHQTADGLPHFPSPKTNAQNGSSSSIRKEFDPPAAGMEFESYDDAYNYYSCYAREAGFSVRVKNSWFKRNSREKYGAVLCCSSQGFKRAKDVNRLRKETRTGCPAMMRMRLVGSKRWRILEVILDHNHALGAKVHKPAKNKLISESDPEAQPAKLYRALVIDTASDGTLSFDLRRADTTSGPPNLLPESHHRFSLSHIVRKVPEKLGGLRNYDAVRKTFLKVVYEALKPFDFETTWGFMIQRFGIADNEWLQSLYEDRALWAPAYLKDTFFMGMAESLNPIFDKCLHKQTPLKEFLDKYELALQRKQREETSADMESRGSNPELRTRCPFEIQVSKIYTRAMFERFRVEVMEMYSCFHTMQVHADGPVSIFVVKERVAAALQEGNRREVREFEILYNRGAGEVRCICGCFNLYGYLCRHALCVLNFNGVEEIPARYILSRWKKDYKRLCVSGRGSGGCDSTGRVEWMGQLYRRAVQVVEEGVISLDHYKVALRAFEESLERMDEASVNGEPPPLVTGGECAMTEYVGRTGRVLPGDNPLPPAVGMEFESYEDVYFFYNCYARQQGFGVRVSNTWYRKGRERYRVKLSCSSAGFKKQTAAQRPRPETRTGCAAMIKFRLMEDSGRWRIIETELDHNHLTSPVDASSYKSHRAVCVGSKRPVAENGVGKIRLFRTVVVDEVDARVSDLDNGRIGAKLSLEKGEFKLFEEFDAIWKAFARAVYHSLCEDEFEDAWEEMVLRYGLSSCDLIKALYEERKRWAPVYLKEVYLAGMFPMKENELLISPFERCLRPNTSLREFLGSYEHAITEIEQRESLSDLESKSSCPVLKSNFYFELQVSKLYTNDVFKNFQDEIEGMYSCLSIRQMSIDGSIATYIVKEDIQVVENRREVKDFEVIYNTSDADSVCACGLFNFRGYLCRHLLSVINQLGLEEIPPQYVLERWRKDIERNYVFDYGHKGIDIHNPLHRYDNLYKCVVKVVEEGRKSRDHYKFALDSLDEILNRVRIQGDYTAK